MNQSTTISRRGAFRAALGLLATFAGVTPLHVSGMGGRSPRRERAPDTDGVYRAYDEEGRIVLEIRPARRWSEVRIYTD